MIEKIEKILKEMNYIYQGFYDFTLQEEDGKYYIIDKFEEFDYGSQDFDNCLEFLEYNLRRIFKNEDLYLEEEFIGRWTIVL